MKKRNFWKALIGLTCAIVFLTSGVSLAKSIKDKYDELPDTTQETVVTENDN